MYSKGSNTENCLNIGIINLQSYIVIETWCKNGISFLFKRIKQENGYFSTSKLNGLDSNFNSCNLNVSIDALFDFTRKKGKKGEGIKETPI